MEHKKNILVVDDDIDIQKALQHKLQKEGCIVRLADSLEECNIQLMDALPDLIIMDAVLTDGNGFEYIAEFQKNEHYKHIGILLMSGMQIGQELSKEALQKGALLFSQKPINFDDFLQKINLIFKVQHLEKNKLDIEQKYHDFFLNSSDVFFILNEHGQILNLSKSFEYICSLAITEQLNKSFSTLLSDQSQEIWGDKFERILKKEVIPSFEAELVNAYKNPIPVDILLTKIEESDTKRGHVIGLMKDLRPLVLPDTIGKEGSNALEREVLSWNSMSGKSTEKTTLTYEVSALSSESSEVFKNMTKAYEELIELSINKRIYKTNTDNKIQQRMYANELGFLKAGPADLIHLHTYCYKNFSGKKNNKKLAFFHEEARIVLLSVMGYLVTFYKNRNTARHE